MVGSFVSGWWFGTWLLCPPYIGNFIIPTDELHHFSEGWLNEFNHQPGFWWAPDGGKTITNQLWRRLRRRPSVKPMENQLPLWHQCYLRNVRG
jgi:hypothetical protein